MIAWGWIRWGYIVGGTITASGTAAAATAAGVQDYAIVVGIDHYDPTRGIPILRGCVNDALLFHQWLTNRAGLDPQRSKLIVSKDNGRPVRDEIEDELITFFRQYLQTGKPVGRRLYLWFSGHGITPAGTYDDCALLMANAGDLALRAIPGKLAADRIRTAAMFQEVILFMDCCREVSGNPDAGLALPNRANPYAGMNTKWLYGFAAMWSSRAAEQLMPNPLDAQAPSLHHGVFTHAILEGLLYAGDQTAGMAVTADSLIRYVRARTQDLLPPDSKQMPEVRHDEMGAPIVFATAAASTVRVKLITPAQGFQVLNGSGLSKLNPPITSVSPDTFSVQLPYGMYVFALPGDGSTFTQLKPVKVFGDNTYVDL
jgi:uncharacterized caspase-like protein